MNKKFVALFILLSSALSMYSQICDSISIQNLSEVVVKGQIPHIKENNGILIVNLPEIVKDKAVTNILEALGYMPCVTNKSGRIWLTGASDVTIILNGELTNMPLQNLYQILSTTPVDRLKNVEIMYSAPAKYHVKGSVINVVLKTPSALDGLQGQVRTSYNQAHYGSYGGALSATYAIKDWSFDLNYGLSKAKSWTHEQAFSNHLFEGSRTMIEDDMRKIGENWANNIYATISWKTLKLTYNGQITSDSKVKTISDGTLGNFTNAYNYESPINYHNIALKYVAPFGMSIGGDYTRYYESRTQSLSNDFSNIFNSNSRQKIDSYHFYVDQEHQLNKWKLNYGIEYQRSVDHSSQVYYTEGMTDFNNTKNEDVASVYVGTERSFSFGLSFNASVKGEYYHNDYLHNWNLIPQLGATYYKTPQNIFQLNVSTQRVYPAYWEIHGGTNYINNYSKVTGNPYLLPYIDYSAQFSYIFKQKYVATLYFMYEDNATVQLPYQTPNTLTLLYQTINMSYKRIAGINLCAPLNIGYIWNATAIANVFNQREKADHFHDISFDNNKWIFYGGLDNSFKFSQNCPVSISLDFSYMSPSLQGIADLSSMWKVDAGVKWTFANNRCCELVLKADDIFNRWSPTMTINNAGQDYKMKVFDMTRNLKMTFIWRFNGFKPKDNNIDTSRFGTGK